MASTDIKLSMIIDSKGTLVVNTKQARELKEALDAGARASAELSKGLATGEAKKALEAQRDAAKKLANEINRVNRESRAAQRALKSIEEPTLDRGLTRGTAGSMSRGDTRDFARQAQGLGGLVHLYATFAANLFAVSAGFTALSKAMDLANMEKASTLLSSSLGVNTKVLATDLQQLTNHALSFSDSLKVINVGLQSGISSKNLKELVVIAKGAAIVMGRDMNDSIDRIIRGTAKQEQEILDELGIIVRAKRAQDEYAQSIGKVGAEALTAAEKQEAFTSAVIKAGQKHKEFANLVSSPYDQLIASIKEVGVSVLSVVNTLFAPLAGFLASSKTAIMAILGGLISYLLSKAVPTLNIIGDNITELTKRNLAAKEAALSKVFEMHDDEIIEKMAKYERAMEKSIKNVEKLKQSAAITNIEGILPKGNKTKELLKGTAEELVANTNKINKAITDSIRVREENLKAIYEARAKGEQVGFSPQKILTMESDLNKLKQNGNELLDKKVGILTKIGIEQQKIISNQANINALEAQGNALDERTEAIKNRILTTSNLKATTFKGLTNFANTLNNPLATVGNKFDSFFEGLSNAGRSVDDEGIERKVGKITKYTEKASYAFRGLGLAAEAAFGMIQKFFLIVFVVTTALAIIEKIARWTGIWSDKTKELSSASSDLTEVLKTQHDFQLKQYELLHSTDMDTASYISKWGKIKESFSQATEKLVELKKKQDELFNSGSALEQLWDRLSLNKKDRAVTIKEELFNRLKDAGVSDEDKGKIASFINSARLKNNFNLLDINKLLKEGLPLLIAVNENSIKLAATNEALIKSYEGLGNSANEAFLKAFETKSHPGFASELGETLHNKLVNPVTELIEKFNTGAVSTVGFSNSISSLVSEFGNLGPEIKRQLPAILELKAALEEMSQFLSKGQGAMASGLSADAAAKKIAADMAEMKKRTEQFRNTAEYKAQEANVLSKAAALGEQIKPLVPPKNSTGKGQDPESRLYKQRMDLLNGEKALIDSKISKTEYELSLEKKRTGLMDETLLKSKYQLDIDRISNNLVKEITEAEENLRLSLKNKDVDRSTANALFKQRESLAFEKANLDSKKAFNELNDKYEENSFTRLKNRLKIEESLLSVSKSKLEGEKSLGLIAEQEYENKKFIQSLEDLSLKTQQNAVGLHDAALEVANAEANATYKKLIIEKDITDALLKRKDILAELSNKQEIISIAIDTARKNNKSTVAVELAAREKIIEKAMFEASTTANINEKLKIKLQLYKDILASLEAEHEARKRNFMNEDNKPQIIYDEAAKQAREFATSLKDSVTGTFDAVYAGMDAAIDELTTKWMKSEKVSIKDLVLTFRDTMAEEIRKMAADQMKSEARNMIKGVLGKIFPGLDMRTNEEKALAYAERTMTATETMAYGGIRGLEGTSKEIKDIGEESVSIFDTIKEKIFNFGDTVMGIFSGLGRFIASIFNFSGGSGSTGGASFGGFGEVFGAIKSMDWGSTNAGVTGGGTGILGSVSDIWTSIMDFFQFKDGGIMSQYGALKLNAYSKGGIANSPQVALYAEGRTPEAYVPLPDGRSIPVTMSRSSTGSSPVSINIVINASTGSSEVTSTGSNIEDMKKLGTTISAIVKQEIVNQKRSGGLLNPRT